MPGHRHGESGSGGTAGHVGTAVLLPPAPPMPPSPMPPAPIVPPLPPMPPPPADALDASEPPPDVALAVDPGELSPTSYPGSAQLAAIAPNTNETNAALRARPETLIRLP